jgi:two-component system chemotaxis response regulator CheB/chemosensory pili system protein ChpB (putative protein-glutamate methylesterase)
VADQGARGLPRIAFVFGDAALAEHVRDAVTGHAEITYAVPAQDFDAARLVDAQVASALVNLDGGDWLDEIESRLDAAGVPVVFNDPDYSRGLDGWDRARWLRHLTAKLCGSDDYDPPRPVAVAPEPGAAPVAADSPAPVAADVPGSDDDSAAGEPPSHSDAAVAERPLSPHEIETMTADFVAAPELHTESASSWQPATVTVQVSTQPFVPATLPEAVPPPEAAVPESFASEPVASAPVASEPVASAPADPGPDASVQSMHEAPGSPGPDATTDLLDVDTEALSAMIDERLAQPEVPVGMREAWDAPNAVSSDAPAPGMSMVDDPAPVSCAAMGTELHPAADIPAVPANDPDADVLASLPSLDDWQLLDDDAVPEVAKSDSRPVAPELPDSLANLTLVPMDPTGSAVPINTDPIERWIDDAEGRSKPNGEGNKA